MRGVAMAIVRRGIAFGGVADVRPAECGKHLGRRQGGDPSDQAHHDGEDGEHRRHPFESVPEKSRQSH